MRRKFCSFDLLKTWIKSTNSMEMWERVRNRVGSASTLATLMKQWYLFFISFVWLFSKTHNLANLKQWDAFENLYLGLVWVTHSRQDKPWFSWVWPDRSPGSSLEGGIDALASEEMVHSEGRPRPPAEAPPRGDLALACSVRSLAAGLWRCHRAPRPVRVTELP